MSNTKARDALIQRIGAAKYEELQQRASDEEWDGVSLDIEPLPLWVAVLCVAALLGIVGAVVWAALWGGRA